MNKNTPKHKTKTSHSIKKVHNHILHNIKLHLIDSTGNLMIANIFYGLMDRLWLGLTSETYLKARITATVMIYAGVGYLYGKGRDIFFKILNKHKLLIDKENNPNIKIRDTIFSIFFSICFGTSIYTISGAPAMTILIGALSSSIIGLLIGAPIGYGIDTLRDLTNTNPPNRIPKKLIEMPQYLKYSLAIILILLSIGILTLIYYI